MPSYLFLGQLNREYILPVEGRPLLDAAGGPVLYAAAGAALWGAAVGLVSRVGENFPQHWLEDLAARGWDVSGVRVLPQPLETRRVLIYDQQGRLSAAQPLQAFARRGITLPRELLTYRPPAPRRTDLDTPTPYTLRLSDLPPRFAEARGAHFCPHDYLTHSLLPATLRTAGVPFISLEPHPSYMDPLFADRLPALLTGLTVFLVREQVLRGLFHHLTGDLWDMAAELARWPVKNIVIRRAGGETWLYETASRRRWVVPGYPVQVSDPTGAHDAFAGAFLAAYRETLDPVQALVRGAVTASVVCETSGAFALLDVLPDLLRRRAEVLAEAVRKV